MDWGAPENKRFYPGWLKGSTGRVTSHPHLDRRRISTETRNDMIKCRFRRAAFALREAREPGARTDRIPLTG